MDKPSNVNSSIKIIFYNELKKKYLIKNDYPNYKTLRKLSLIITFVIKLLIKKLEEQLATLT